MGCNLSHPGLCTDCDSKRTIASLRAALAASEAGAAALEQKLECLCITMKHHEVDLFPLPSAKPDLLAAHRAAVDTLHQRKRAALSAPAGASLLARQEAMELDLANARRFLLQLADDEERHIGASGTVTIRPRIWDHACAQCIPDGDLVKPGFVCAVHAARAALAGLDALK
jgi:hypothetical protein